MTYGARGLGPIPGILQDVADTFTHAPGEGEALSQPGSAPDVSLPSSSGVWQSWQAWTNETLRDIAERAHRSMPLIALAPRRASGQVKRMLKVLPAIEKNLAKAERDAPRALSPRSLAGRIRAERATLHMLASGLLRNTKRAGKEVAAIDTLGIVVIYVLKVDGIKFPLFNVAFAAKGGAAYADAMLAESQKLVKLAKRAKKGQGRDPRGPRIAPAPHPAPMPVFPTYGPEPEPEDEDEEGKGKTVLIIAGVGLAAAATLWLTS